MPPGRRAARRPGRGRGRGGPGAPARPGNVSTAACHALRADFPARRGGWGALPWSFGAGLRSWLGVNGEGGAMAEPTRARDSFKNTQAGAPQILLWGRGRVRRGTGGCGANMRSARWEGTLRCRAECSLLAILDHPRGECFAQLTGRLLSRGRTHAAQACGWASHGPREAVCMLWPPTTRHEIPPQRPASSFPPLGMPGNCDKE